jgi:hypothetical protein
MKKLIIIVCFIYLIGCDKDNSLNKTIYVPGYQEIFIVDEYRVNKIHLDENCSEIILTWSPEGTEINYFCTDELSIGETDYLPPR